MSICLMGDMPSGKGGIINLAYAILVFIIFPETRSRCPHGEQITGGKLSYTLRLQSKTPMKFSRSTSSMHDNILAWPEEYARERERKKDREIER